MSSEDKAMYTQAEVDSIILPKAIKLIRKALKDAGIEIDIDNKRLLPKIVELVKAGTEKTKELQGKEAAITDILAAEVQRLKINITLLAAATKHDPMPAKAVIKLLTADDNARQSCAVKSGVTKPHPKQKAVMPGLFVKARRIHTKKIRGVYYGNRI